jgi:ribosomal protein S18 acetylase RimI-like enzyme
MIPIHPDHGMIPSRPDHGRIAIRPAGPADAEAIWGILRPIIAAGETYALPRDMTRAEALAYWLAPSGDVFVAEWDGVPAGSCVVRANRPGGGAHVANASFATAPDFSGRGIARAMCGHALDHARSRGFRAMQFNFVIASNTRAVALWRAMGFDVVGRVPGAFAHPSLGFVDALIMHRVL